MSPLLERVLQELAQLSAEEQLEVIAQAAAHLQRRSAVRSLDAELDLSGGAPVDPLIELFSASPDLSAQAAWQIDETEPQADLLADLKASIRQGQLGETFPISQLWDEMDD